VNLLGTVNTCIVSYGIWFQCVQDVCSTHCLSVVVIVQLMANAAGSLKQKPTARSIAKLTKPRCELISCYISFISARDES